jgi:hypothetical protein
MTTSPTGPDSSTPADPYAEPPLGADELTGQDGGADGGADAGADVAGDRPTDGSGAGADDPTTETDEDTRFA